MTLPSAALARALSERDDYRLALFSALDQMHEQARTIERQREQLQEARDLWSRCAERLMKEDE